MSLFILFYICATYFTLSKSGAPARHVPGGERTSPRRSQSSWARPDCLTSFWIAYKRRALVFGPGRVFSWSFASQNDFIGGSVSCGVALVHCGSGAVGSPHPTRLSPGHLPPRGRLCLRDTTQSLPLGGRWPRSGRMRATFRKQSVVYQRSNALTIFIPVTPSTPSNTALQTKHTPAPPPSWRRQATHRIVKSRAGKKR